MSALLSRARLIAFYLVLGGLHVDVLGADLDRREVVLDPMLKVLYRAQQGTATLTRSQAAELMGRIQPRRVEARDAGLNITASLPMASSLRLVVKHGGNRAALEQAGFAVRACVGTICSGTLPQDRLSNLIHVAGVQVVELSRELRAFGESALLLPSSGTPSLSFPASALGASEEAAGGAGVLVAFIDTGADIFHTDFRNADGSTRIQALLDLSLPGDTDRDGDLDGSGPCGGTEFTESQINAALVAGTFASKDPTGHGTHGLSIAAGDNPERPGLAPAADLLVVKATREGNSLGFFTDDIIAALEWVDEQANALDQPYVVNLSLGSLFGSHDGRSLEEQAIDTLVGPGRSGRVVVAAAGNAADNRGVRHRHLSGTAYAGSGSTHTLVVPPYTPNAGKGDDRIVLDLWYEGRDELDIVVTTPDGGTVAAQHGRFADERTTAGDVFIANMGGASPQNGDIEAIILIDDWSGTAPMSGEWGIAVTGAAVLGSGRFDGWLLEESVAGDAGSTGQLTLAPGTTVGGLPTLADNRLLVGRPGTANHAVTVGSYARHGVGTRFLTSWTEVHGLLRQDTSALDGELSDFSSPGPTRDGRRKPEVAAPGERVMGAVSRDALPGVSPASIYRYHPFQEPEALLVSDAADAAFGMLQGTSFSAPVVTGLAARILSLSPGLDAVQVRNVLINGATTDGSTGAGPDDEWGHGKADLDVGLTTPLPSDLLISADPLPKGAIGEQYAFAFTASGGALPYMWSIADGPLPEGLAIDEAGHLVGRPTLTGTSTFTVHLTDSSVPTPQHASRECALEVSDHGTLRVSTTHLPVARIDRSYFARIEAAGGVPPYTWSLAGGGLPPGLSLSAGEISGVATTLGKWSFTLRAVDAEASVTYWSSVLLVREAEQEQWHALGKVVPSVKLLVVDPNQPDRVLAATRNIDGVFETTNAGQSWSPISVNTGLNNPVLTLGVNPTNSEVWVTQAESGGGSLLARKTMWFDASVAGWRLVATVSGGDWATIEFSPDGRVFSVLSGDRKLVESVAHGKWSPAAGTEATVLCGDWYLSFPSIAFYGRAGRVYVLRKWGTTCLSDDLGRTWYEVTNRSKGELDIQVASDDPTSVMKAGVEVGRAFVEWSADSGRNWNKAYVSSFRKEQSPDTLFVQLRRSQSDPRIALVASEDGLHKSEDGAVTWRTLQMGLAEKGATAVAIDPTDARVVYAAAAGGIYRSSDGGDTWVQASNGLVRRQITDLRMSDTSADELVLGSIEGAYLSRNAGATWIRSTTGLTNTVVRRVAISSVDPELTFLGTDGGVFRSADRGVSWSRVDGTAGTGYSCRALEVAPSDAGIVIFSLSGTRGSYRSVDGGRTFVPANVGLPFETPNDLSFARDAGHSGTLYIALEKRGVYRSDDLGLSWAAAGLDGQTVQAVEVAPSDGEHVYAAASKDIYRWVSATGSWEKSSSAAASTILCLAVDPIDPLVAFAGADHPGNFGQLGGVYRTADGGQTWQRLPGPLDQHDVVAIATHPATSGVLFAATSLGGAYRSADGGSTWELLSNYGTVADTTNVTVQDPTNPFLLYAGTDGFGVQASVDGGKTFAAKVKGLGNYYVNALAFDATDPARLYAGTDAGVFVSTNSAGTWAPTGLTLGEVTEIVTDAEGTARRIWVTVEGEGVAFSSDGGAHFSTSSTGLDSLRLTSIEIERSGTNTRRIWVTSRGGSGVAYSDDLGGTWVSAAGMGLTERNLNDVTIESSARRIWVTGDSGVFFSENAGLSWTVMSRGLPPGTPVTSLSIDPNTGEALVSLFSAEEGGVYRGRPGAGRWERFSGGLGELKVNRLTNSGSQVIDASTLGTTFFAATRGDGIYRAEVLSARSDPPVITTTKLPGVVVGFAYHATLSVTGGQPPFTWSVVSGSLPAGLALEPLRGEITGTAVAPANAEFTVQVVDTSRREARKSLTIGVGQIRPVRRALKK
jgi:photosystem II stability/assembly factor-like uncharacterized protein